MRLPRPTSETGPDFELIEHPDRWVVQLGGKPVTSCNFHELFYFQVGDLISVIEIFLMRPFRLTVGDQQYTLSPATGRPIELGPALALLHRRAEAAVAWKDGRLRVSFSDGSIISAEPDALDEAWSIDCTDESFELRARPAGAGVSVTKPDRQELVCRCRQLTVVEGRDVHPYAYLHLIILSDDQERWRTLYSCPGTGKLWVRTHTFLPYRNGRPPEFSSKLEPMSRESAQVEFAPFR